MNKSCSIAGCTIERGNPGYEVRTGTCRATGANDWLANAVSKSLCAVHAQEAGLLDVLKRIRSMQRTNEI